jgi:cyclohexyl-isocyanide hydratase
MDGRLQIGFLLFPRLTQLDMTGPFEVFARLPDAKVHIAWKTIDPVISDVGLALLPTVTLADCPQLDLICIPGGPGVNSLLEDAEVLDFVGRQGGQARYVTSVCTGALVLGAAGLLRGYQAATHWASMQFLEAFGATPVRTRVCVDRNRITGGGVTAGIDFGLTLAGEVADEATAQAIQLYMEYNPQPPFQAGSPDTAPACVLEAFRISSDAMIKDRCAAVERAAARLAENEHSKLY